MICRVAIDIIIILGFQHEATLVYLLQFCRAWHLIITNDALLEVHNFGEGRILHGINLWDVRFVRIRTHFVFIYSWHVSLANIAIPAPNLVFIDRAKSRFGASSLTTIQLYGPKNPNYWKDPEAVLDKALNDRTQRT